MNRKTSAESGGRPSKGNYFEERAEKGSFLFNFKVSKDLRKQDGLKTSKILTVESLFIFAFFIGIRNAKINVSLAPVPIRPDRHIQRRSHIEEQSSREFYYRAS